MAGCKGGCVTPICWLADPVAKASPIISNEKVLAQCPARIRLSKAPAALQLGYQEIDKLVQHVDGVALRMPEHEAAAAAGGLKHLFEIIGNLRRGAGLRGAITGRSLEAVVEELLQRDLPVVAMRLGEHAD